MDMLVRASKAIKKGIEPDLTAPLNLTADINLHCSALIPEDYVGDVPQRLLFYKRISNAESKDALTDIRTEMIDRFGALPTHTTPLISIHQLRLLAEPLHVTRVDATGSAVTIEFAPDTPVDALTIIKLIQSDGKRYRMSGASGIRYSNPDKLETPQQRINMVRELLEHFGGFMG